MASDTSSEVNKTNDHEKNIIIEVKQISLLSKKQAEAQKIILADRSLLQKIIRKGLVETNGPLELKQKVSGLRLNWVETFEDLKLRPTLLQGVHAMGFKALSRIQAAALPIILSDIPENLIVQSPSGTGKSAAFILAMLNRVDTSINVPQIICLSPTYELAVQTGEVISLLGRFCPEIQVVFAVRGFDIHDKLGAHIIIGTPGKIIDWAFRHKFFDMAKIKMFVVDEADVMIESEGYRSSAFKLQKKLTSSCQKLLFSTTYDEGVMHFAEELFPDATILRLKSGQEDLDNTKQFYIECKNSNAVYQAIANVFETVNIGRAIIICPRASTASWLLEQLTRNGYPVGIFSGELKIDQRHQLSNRFHEGKERILITTNVNARGHMNHGRFLPCLMSVHGTYV